MIYFTSDIHFDHENIIKYCNRPYSSKEEMNEDIIKKWNETVTPADIVFHLGDIAMCSTHRKDTVGKLEKIANLVSRLNGHKIIMKGNHDSEDLMKLLTNPFNYVKCKYVDPEYEEEIDLLNDDLGKTKIVMNHFPLYSWHYKEKGNIHLFGHMHGQIKNYHPNALDVGWDVFQRPVSIQEIGEIIVNNNYKRRQISWRID